jgi:O-antigen/teichoic acid export membrane protein
MMSLKQKFIKGGAVLGITQLLGQVCSLGRNIIIARIISPADFGIASIFLMVVSFLEMISNLSLDRLLVQSPDGNNERFQQTAHLLQAFRGILASILLILLAKPIAIIFSIPETYLAFIALALIPLINGFCHLDPRRVERNMRFWPYAFTELSSQVVVVILAWPVAIWLRDYKAMLLLLIIKVTVMMAGSHYIAVRKYRWARDPEYMKRFLAFGWPLLVNGLLLFAMIQGDRLIIGSAQKLFGTPYTMADVGLYSSAFMIAMTPSMIFIRIQSSLMLPELSITSKDQTKFQERYAFFSDIVASICIILSLLLVVAGPSILILIFGEEYHSAAKYVPWLSLMWMVRIMRTVPSQAAIAKGKTKIIMVSNLVRMITLPVIFALVAMNKSLVLIAITGLIGEIVAHLINIILNNRYGVINIASSFRSTVTIIVFSIITVAIYHLRNDASGLYSDLTFLSIITPGYMIILAITLLRWKNFFRNSGKLEEGHQ